MAPKKKEKTITGWTIVDWKKGDVRSRKTEPETSELGPVGGAR